jgi:hypothetical protein
MLIASKNTKGILLFLLASMMAEDMKGPTNEEEVPTIENNEKKRISFPRGHTSEIIQLLDHSSERVRLTVGIERTNTQAVISLEQPDCCE